MTGFEMCVAIKADSAAADMTVALMTGYSGYSELSETVRKAGAAALITKPFEINDLLDILTSVLAEIPQYVSILHHVATQKHPEKWVLTRVERV